MLIISILLLFSIDAHAIDPCVVFSFYKPGAEAGLFDKLMQKYGSKQTYQNILLECFSQYKETKGTLKPKLIGGKLSGESEIEFFIQKNSDLISQDFLAANNATINNPAFIFYDFLKNYDETLETSGYREYLEYSQNKYQIYFKSELSKINSPLNSENLMTAFQLGIASYLKKTNPALHQVQNRVSQILNKNFNLQKLLFTDDVFDVLFMKKTFTHNLYLMESELFHNHLHLFLGLDDGIKTIQDYIKNTNNEMRESVIMHIDEEKSDDELLKVESEQNWKNKWSGFLSYYTSYKLDHNHQPWIEKMIEAVNSERLAQNLFLKRLTLVQELLESDDFVNFKISMNQELKQPLLKILELKSKKMGSTLIRELDTFTSYSVQEFKKNTHRQKPKKMLDTFESLHREILAYGNAGYWKKEDLKLLGLVYTKLEYLLPKAEYKNSKKFLFQHRTWLGTELTQKLYEYRDQADCGTLLL